MEKCCSAFGHGDFFLDVEDDLRRTVADLSEKQGVKTFMTGGMGDFDALFCRAVREAKARDGQIRLILVKPYFSNELNANQEIYRALYDEVILPAELAHVHYKAAIQKRNQWIIDRSSVVISGVYREFGGAFQAIRYAIKTGKPIIEVVKQSDKG